MCAERVIVTAALPYANGSLHLGHLVEYCQTDMYVRALRRMGVDARYICANDAHGTPIEVNAGRMGITPETLVARVHDEHQADFAKFDVVFDHFSITHSDTNRQIVNDVYEKLRSDGHLDDREMELSWCDTDQRFLPDRYVKGTCPHCKAQDQYGDVCENCKRTYGPTDLEEPFCILCGNTPVRKTSDHVFFKLAPHSEFLLEWLDSGAVQNDQAKYIRSWVEKGLQDWCISRDGPYFGFEIPDKPGKYFYVWLDAPLGYAASSVEWGKENGLGFDELWKSENTRIEHIIGKDIVYFHTLFWPAVLKSVGYTLPSKVHVHGMLTVDGEKMSKSRGTFINGATFAQHVEPQALRYYYACKYGAGAEDLDLAFEDFVLRINAELVNKHANLFSRAAQFLLNKLDGKLGDLPFTAEEARQPPVEGDESMLNLARRVVAHARRIEELYRAREFGQAVRELCAISDIGNEFMQSRAPWAQLKEGDEAAARQTCTFALNVCYALAAYMWPIVPRFCDAGARILRRELTRMSVDDLFAERDREIGPMVRLFERLDLKQVEKVVADSKQDVPDGQSKKSGTKKRSTKDPSKNEGQNKNKGKNKDTASADGDTISFKEFQRLNLRVGIITSAEPIKKSDKLLKLMVDIGEETPRQIVAGIAKAYDAEALVGSKVVVLANLAPAKLMGVESQGMVLAGGEGDGLAVLRLDRELEPGAVVR